MTHPEWLNPPPRWRQDQQGLHVTTAGETDFWRHTHYGFVRDSGHFLGTTIDGDFTSSVRFHGAYDTQYDQAGLMVRQSDEVWIKAGIEFVDGIQYASVVVTRTTSDWSVAPLDPQPAVYWIRIQRSGASLTVDGSVDGATWQLLRTTWLSEQPTLLVGPMCASPQGAGFDVVFTDFSAEPATQGTAQDL